MEIALQQSPYRAADAPWKSLFLFLPSFVSFFLSHPFLLLCFSPIALPLSATLSPDSIAVSLTVSLAHSLPFSFFLFVFLSLTLSLSSVSLFLGLSLSLSLTLPLSFWFENGEGRRF